MSSGSVYRLGRPRDSLLLLLVGLSCTVALAHEDHHEEMDMLHHAASVNQTSSSPSQVVTGSKVADSFWTYEDSRFLLYSHIGIMIVGWVFVLPISIMFSVAKSSLHIPTQALFLALHCLGVMSSVAYQSRVPDFYQQNAHGRMSWLATFVLVGQAVIGIVFLRGSRNDEKIANMGETAEERDGFLAVPTSRSQSLQRSSGMSDSAHGDSGGSSRCSFNELEQQKYEQYPENQVYNDTDEEEYETLGRESNQNQQRHPSGLVKLLNRVITNKQFSSRPVRIARLFYSLVQRLIIIWGFIIIVTGLVTLFGTFKERSILNGIAHLTKGGIFFFLGVLGLGRYLGAFAEIGWAWNLRPSDSMINNKWLARAPSAEMFESFLVFLYGIINIWLEHLSAWGSNWTPMDLEHAAISFWFLGCGLCGMLIESRKLRQLPEKVLQSNLKLAAASGPQYFPTPVPEDVEPTPVRSPSLNPVPSFAILMLGILMGGHHQHVAIGATIHKLWGMLLSSAVAMRLFTYALLHLSPPSSYFPTRPFTELISAFFLMAGGLVFMMSNRDTVDYLARIDVDVMFIFTVVIGFTALIMSWEVTLFALKGWAARREILRRTTKSKYNAAV